MADQQHKVKPLPFKSLNGISDKTNEIHHGKLYTGYVNKRNEIENTLKTVDRTSANATYSQIGELKRQETFAANGMILHEVFFGHLGGDGATKSKVAERIKKDFGSYENWQDEFKACAMASRGWCILAYDPSDSKLHTYIGDAHNQGGVWGCTPIICLDVYEHAYFIDFGGDKKAYIETFFKNLNWKAIDEMAKKQGLKI